MAELEDLTAEEFLDVLISRLEAKGTDMSGMRAYQATVAAIETGDPTPLPGSLMRPERSVFDTEPIAHVEGMVQPEDIVDRTDPDHPVGPRTLRRWHREAQRVHRLQWATIAAVLLVAPWLSVAIFRLWPW